MLRGDPFLWPGLGVTLIAVIGALLVLRTTEAADHRARWIELGLILAIGLAFRLIFISAPPAFSYDAYRYAWDAHLVSHGVSPYSHTVDDPALISLRDGAIWPKLNWRDAPTIYPPGAQVFFLLIHAVAPLNIEAVKLAMALCDLGIGIVTVFLLRQQRMDLRRVIIYWWSPIPILEFVYNAHLDAVAILLVALALLVAGQHFRGARALVGVLLGLAALTKLYPLLFVFALARRRDWALFAGLGVTLVVIILPFAALGLGSGGFLSTYFSQRYVDQGILLRLYDALILSRTLQVALLGASLLAFCALAAWLRACRGLESYRRDPAALRRVDHALAPPLPVVYRGAAALRGARLAPALTRRCHLGERVRPVALRAGGAVYLCHLCAGTQPQPVHLVLPRAGGGRAFGACRPRVSASGAMAVIFAGKRVSCHSLLPSVAARMKE